MTQENIKNENYVTVEITEDLTYGGKVIKFPSMNERNKENAEDFVT